VTWAALPQTGWPRTVLLAVAASLVPLAGGAAEIFLKSGGHLSGRIVSRNPTTIEVDIGAGVIGVDVSGIARIDETKSPLEEYHERATRVPPGDLEAWLALGEWASVRGLGAQAAEAYQRALIVSPADPRAHTALGHTLVDGRWLSEDESYRARGYIRFEREWITPAEHEAILRERAADAAQAQAQLQADLNAREAEARAQEAETRARQAAEEAAAAAEQAEASSVMYGWGPGPTVWPTGNLTIPRWSR